MRFDPIAVTLSCLGIIIVVLFVLFAGRQPGVKTDIDNKSNQTTDRSAKIDIEEKEFYLRPNVVIKQKDILINNLGNGPLDLSRVKTSSNSITAQFVPTNQDINSTATLTIEPNESGLLRVNFNENFDWNNPQSEQVSFTTNDPDSPSVVINFYAQN